MRQYTDVINEYLAEEGEDPLKSIDTKKTYLGVENSASDSSSKHPPKIKHFGTPSFEVSTNKL